MREIKFRAWEMTLKQMLIVTNLHLDTKGAHLSKGKTVLLSHTLIAMQYTGLKDKNGKEIYEGDILRHNREAYIGKVWFCDGCFMTDCEGFGNQPMNDLDLGWIEVIGNIYENPELLKE